jgi:hypothetical protein
MGFRNLFIPDAIFIPKNECLLQTPLFIAEAIVYPIFVFLIRKMSRLILIVFI